MVAKRYSLQSKINQGPPISAETYFGTKGAWPASSSLTLESPGPPEGARQSLGEQILTVAQPAVGVVDDDTAGLHALRLLAARLVGHAGRLGLVDGSAADERRLDPEARLAAARRRRTAGPRR